jgi:hypothetical protein
VITPERKRELRVLARARAFISGFGDAPIEGELAALLQTCIASPQEARYTFSYFIRARDDFAKRAIAAHAANDNDANLAFARRAISQRKATP